MFASANQTSVCRWASPIQHFLRVLLIAALWAAGTRFRPTTMWLEPWRCASRRVWFMDTFPCAPSRGRALRMKVGIGGAWPGSPLYPGGPIWQIQLASRSGQVRATAANS